MKHLDESLELHFTKIKSHINLFFNIHYENNRFFKPRQMSVATGGTKGPIESNGPPAVSRAHRANPKTQLCQNVQKDLK